MKLLEVFRFEVSYQFRQRTTWLYLPAMFMLALYAMQNFMQGAREAGTVLNAPVIIANATFMTSLFGLLVVAALFGEAATRDVQTALAPLIYTSSIRESHYLGGRFLGAFTLSALLLATVPLGVAAAVLLSKSGGGTLAPFNLGSYLRPFLLWTLPNLFIAGALIYTVGLFTRRAVAGFVLCVTLGFGSMLVWELLAKTANQWTLASLVDPLGLTATGALLRSWTTAQRSTLEIPLAGTLLWNRFLWLALAAVLLGAVAMVFRFGHHVSAGDRRRARRPRPAEGEMRPSSIVVPAARQSFDTAARARKTVEIAAASLRQILAGRLWLLPVGGLAVLLIAGPELMEHLGVPLIPEAPLLIAKLSSLHIDSLVVLLLILFAGELVWRDREGGVAQLVETTPVRNGTFLLGKFLGLAAAVVLFQLLFMITCVAIQFIAAYREPEIGSFLRILFGYQLVDYLLFAGLALALHVLVHQKYLASLIAVLVFLYTKVAGLIGVEHKLLIFGSDLGWSYSSFTGYPSIGPFVLFKLYWTGWALLLASAAWVLWVRSVESGGMDRLHRAMRGRTRGPLVTAAVSVALIVVSGGVIFYNTNILNEYRSGAENVARRAAYEQRYGQYESIAQPRLLATTLRIDLHPEAERAEITGHHRLSNRSDQPITTILVATASEVETRNIEIDLPFRALQEDHDLGQMIYELEEPLQPGEEAQLRFEVLYEPRGFTNGGIQTAVSAEATYFEPGSWLPAIGYQESRRLRTAKERRQHGLPERPEVPHLDDQEARWNLAGREMVDVDITVGTSGNQLALAPGRLQREWRENDRRYFHYTTDQPIRNLSAIFSADYAVHEAKWQDVEIEVVHHPTNTRNLERMVQSVQASLEYFTEHLGPYPHGQIRLVEAPRGGIGLRAYPVNIRYNEGVSRMDPSRDHRGVDFLFGVVAHEVAHQWWGNQLLPAQVEGAPLLSESLAWYSAFGIVEQARGAEELRRLLYVMREAYLAPRPLGDESLLRASDWLDSYRRGPFAMYALRSAFGEEKVNTALRRVLRKFGDGEPPLPTSLDLYRELKAVTPSSLRPMVADLFERNTYWNLSTRNATAEPLGDGSWRVTMEVTADKLVMDKDGNDTRLPINDLVEIGVYGTDDDAEPLYLEMHRINEPVQEISITVPSEPAHAGIDPRRLLIDPNWRNNTTAVRTAGEKSS